MPKQRLQTIKSVIPMILPSAPCLLWKSWCVCLFFPTTLIEGKQTAWEDLRLLLLKTTMKQNTTDTETQKLIRTGRYRNIKNNNPIRYENDCNSPPRSYGIHFGNHISPGKHNCGRFSVSTVSWIYLTAERHSDLWRSAVWRVPWLSEHLKDRVSWNRGESKMMS